MNKPLNCCLVALSPTLSLSLALSRFPLSTHSQFPPVETRILCPSPRESAPSPALVSVQFGEEEIKPRCSESRPHHQHRHSCGVAINFAIRPVLSLPMVGLLCTPRHISKKKENQRNNFTSFFLPIHLPTFLIPEFSSPSEKRPRDENQHHNGRFPGKPKTPADLIRLLSHRDP